MHALDYIVYFLMENIFSVKTAGKMDTTSHASKNDESGCLFRKIGEPPPRDAI
jgi:hypothetical protein